MGAFSGPETADSGIYWHWMPQTQGLMLVQVLLGLI